MNDNAKKWVAALRSGYYKQGKGYLCKDNHYCCLGVACELFIESGGELDKEEISPGTFAYEEYPTTLPEKVKDWLGLAPYSNVRLNFYGDLVRMNDEDGKSFTEIADFIESEPEGLFV